MRKQIAAAVLAGLTMLVGGGALADGMARRSIKDAPVVAAPSWSGFYLGGGAGYGHLIGDNKYAEDGFAQSWTSEGASGGFGTVTIGFDRLVRERYVVGVFADADWGSIEGHYRDTDGFDQSFKIRNAYSIGGRGGFLMTPQSLLFVTGGYTWAKMKSNGYFDINEDGLGKSSLNLNGPFVGVGMETQLGRNWSLRGEVRYTMFGEVTTNPGDGTYIDKMDANLLAGRLEVVYKFGRDEPHVAPIK